MTVPYRGSGSSSYQIEVNWTPLTGSDTGNSPILAYSLWWDKGDGVSSVQLSESNSTAFVVSGVSIGNNYTFWVRAKNIYGYGQFSPTVSIVAAEVPNTLASVVTSLYGSSSVQLSWFAPTDSVAIYYQVQLFNPKLLKNFDDLTNCNGQSNTVLSSLSCVIPLTTLTQSFGYSYGDTVRATVRVMNKNGWSNYSPLNN